MNIVIDPEHVLISASVVDFPTTDVLTFSLPIRPPGPTKTGSWRIAIEFVDAEAA